MGAVDPDLIDSLGKLQGMIKGGFVLPCFGIEEYEVCPAPFFDQPAVGKTPKSRGQRSRVLSCFSYLR
uniref:hypothetical protein n=1 Tax=Algoriphagus sp. TaxID=1872435 RepID=UPI0040478A96